MRRAALLLLLAGCGPAAPDRGRLLVLTTFQPLYSFAANVAEGGGIDVVNLAPRREGPHDFDYDTPRVRGLVRRADAVVTLGSLRLAPRFDRFHRWCRGVNIRIVEIDPAAVDPPLPLIRDPGGTNPNPHVWLSVSHAIRMVGTVARDFAALDPVHAERYRRNAVRVQADLRAFKARAERALAEVGDLSVVALTEGFPYLTADLGIDVAATVLDGKDVGRRIREARVRAVIAEEDPGPGVRAEVERAGARLAVLSTLEEGWGAGDALDPDGYLAGMEANLRALLRAFGRE